MIPASVMQQIAQRVRDDAARRIVAQGQSATGRTAARIRPEALEDVARVFGPEHLGALETGVSPSSKYTRPGKAYVADIAQWMAARRLTGSAYALARSILLRGTRLYRGEDPRFPKPSGTFSGLLTPAYLGALRAQLQVGARPAIRSEVLNALKF